MGSGGVILGTAQYCFTVLKYSTVCSAVRCTAVLSLLQANPVPVSCLLLWTALDWDGSHLQYCSINTINQCRNILRSMQFRQIRGVGLESHIVCCSVLCVDCFHCALYSAQYVDYHHCTVHSTLIIIIVQYTVHWLVWLCSVVQKSPHVKYIKYRAF